MTFINRFSFVLFVLIPALFFLVLLLRGEGSRLKQVAALGLLSAVVLLFFVFRPGGSGATLAGDEAEAKLAGYGAPVLVEVYSDY